MDTFIRHGCWSIALLYIYSRSPKPLHFGRPTVPLVRALFCYICYKFKAALQAGISMASVTIDFREAQSESDGSISQ
jgi:hypothetical protein